MGRKTTIKMSDKKSSEALNVENIDPLEAEKKYEKQIENVKKILKQSMNSLTEDELRSLYVKYKTDGHYRVVRRVSPYTFLNVAQNIPSVRHVCCDKAKQYKQEAIPNNLSYKVANENKYKHYTGHMIRIPNQETSDSQLNRLVNPYIKPNVPLVKNNYREMYNYDYAAYNSATVENVPHRTYQQPLNMNNAELYAANQNFSDNLSYQRYVNSSHTYNTFDTNSYIKPSTSSMNQQQNTSQEPAAHNSQLIPLYANNFSGGQSNFSQYTPANQYLSKMNYQYMPHSSTVSNADVSYNGSNSTNDSLPLCANSSSFAYNYSTYGSSSSTYNSNTNSNTSTHSYNTCNTNPLASTFNDSILNVRPAAPTPNVSNSLLELDATSFKSFLLETDEFV